MPRSTTTTDQAPTPAGPYSQHARIGNVVQAAGQVGFLPDGTLLDGVGEQTRQALNNVLAVLEAGGASERDIISVRVFLTEVSQFEEMNAVYETVFSDPPPARSTVYVGLRPGLVVVIVGLALVADAS
jgi:reactive intermediate/imine deaminase